RRHATQADERGQAARPRLDAAHRARTGDRGNLSLVSGPRGGDQGCMKLLVLGLNYAPEKIGIAVYTTGMAEALAAAGHEVQVVAGRPYYPGWAIMEGHNGLTYGRSTENGVDVTRVPHYIPKTPSGLKRILHYATFALASFFPMLLRALFWRPDVVMTI